MKFLIDFPRITRFAPIATVVLCALVAVTACLQAINFPFFGDDATYIVENSKLKGLGLPDMWRLFVEPYNSWEFLPLRDMSYWLDMELFGMAPSIFRLHNLLLYFICCLLIYAVTLNLWSYFKPAEADSAPWVAAMVAAIFALHPAHIESVVLVSGRKDVLSGFFSLLSLWFATGARRAQSLEPWHAGAALITLVAAMLSKATTVVVAPMIGILWIVFWLGFPAVSRRRTMLLWPLACLLVAACVAMIFMGHSSIRLPVYYGVEAYTRALAILGWMVRLAITPESRHFFYPVFEDSWLWCMVALGAAVILAAAVGLVMLLRRRSLEWFALVIFALLCLPFTQLLPYTTQSLVADRFLFLALWPLLLLLVLLAWRFKPVFRAALLIVVLPWNIQFVEHPKDYWPPAMIIDRDVEAYPGHFLPLSRQLMGKLWLGAPYSDNVSYSRETLHESLRIANEITDLEIRKLMTKLVGGVDAVYNGTTTTNLQETISFLHGEEADLRTMPARTKWNIPLLQPYEQSRMVLEQEWLYLAKKFPNDVLVRFNTGICLLEHYKFESAATNLRVAVESSQLPVQERGRAFKSLGVALLNSGHIAESEIPLRSALEQSPPDTEAYCALAEVYRHTKRTAEATRADFDCRINSPNGKAAQVE